jgi:cytochrome P450
MDFNPLAFEVKQNPNPYYAHLRDQAPAYWVESLQAWAVSRYRDVAYVAKNTQLFSSAPIILAILGDQNPVPEVSWLISADPPAHTKLRRLVNKAFTPRMVAALDLRIKEIVSRLLDSIEQGEEFDLVRDFSTPLPLMVIAEMLGIEPERYREFKTMVRRYGPGYRRRDFGDRTRKATRKYERHAALLRASDQRAAAQFPRGSN